MTTVRLSLDLAHLPRVAAPATRRAVEGIGFAAFVRLAWPWVEPAEMVPSWHIDEICEFLDGVARDRKREIDRDFSIEVPPASTKSLLASVLWQAWVWTWWPESRWITTTYEQGLANDLSKLSLDLVSSEWYQAAWPLKITRDAASHWANDRGGWRRSLGIGGATTGKHAHFQLGDDLIKEQLARLGTASQIADAVKKATSFWFVTMGTRKVAKAVARGLINQRLHVDDPSGVAVREHGYEQIMFPARFEPERADPRDHRKVPGEVLCEARCDEDGWQKIEKALGPIASRAQLGQDPAPIGGRVLQPAWLEHRYEVLPAELRRTISDGIVGAGQEWGTFWDLNFKGEEVHSRVAGQAWCWFQEKAWLVDAVVEHTAFLGALQMLRDMAAAYPFIADHCLEDAANAPALEETIDSALAGVQLEPMGGGTLARTQSRTGWWRAGDVMLPADAPFMGGSQGFVAEHAGFDGMKTRPDDQVSTSSLALVHFQSGTGSLPDWAMQMKGGRR